MIVHAEPPPRKGPGRRAPTPRTCPNRWQCLQAALEFREWGWSAFPLFQKRPAVAYWTTKGGRRAVERGWADFQRRAPSEQLILRMFQPDFDSSTYIDGVAVVTGPVSGGLCVRDFDRADAYRDWAAANPALAGAVPTARTGRGFHVYFRLPAGHGPVYRNLGDGELIGDGKHYIVAPPSRHPDGAGYQWLANRPFRPTDLPTLPPSVFLPSVTQGSHPTGAPASLYTSSVTQDSVRASSAPEAVARCLPSGPGERNDCLWRLARTLKTVPEVVAAWKGAPHTADACEAVLWPHFERWYEGAAGVIGTKSCAVCWADFKRQWKAARVPMGGGFRNAVAIALEGPFPAEAARYGDEPTRRLVAVCSSLQRFAGDDPFFLSCRTAAEVCGFGSAMTASRRLKTLVNVGLLDLTERGTQSADPSRQKASRYRWVGSGPAASLA